MLDFVLDPIRKPFQDLRRGELELTNQAFIGQSQETVKPVSRNLNEYLSKLYCMKNNCAVPIDKDKLKTFNCSVMDVSGEYAKEADVAFVFLSPSRLESARYREKIESALKEQVKGTVRSGTLVPGWLSEMGFGKLKWNKPYEEIILLGEMMSTPDNIIDLRQKKPITPTQ